MILGLDIGGSFIKAAYSSREGELVDLGRWETPADDFETFSERLQVALKLAPVPVGQIAISVTGVVDPNTDIITCANIPCIHGRSLAKDLQSQLGVPITLANDADCFVLAEALGGAGRGHDIVFGIILGSGVGGGVATGGRLINRNGDFAGEWGHGPAIGGSVGDPPVTVPAYECSCGQHGCVNTVGGARGMERLHKLLHAEEVSSNNIVSSWEAGERKSAATIELFTDLLANPLALAVNITGASIVPAGGGLANSAALLSKIDTKTRKRTLRTFKHSLVIKADCGTDAGLAGAVALGWSTIKDG